MATFNLTSLYLRTFGFTALPYGQLDARTQVTDAQRFDALEARQPVGEETGLLGTPIHLPLRLGDFKFPNEPLVELSMQRRIVITDIDGNDGSFKELYSNGDVQVTIRAILVNDDDPDSYPEDLVRALRNVLEERKHVRIINRLTAMFNVEHIAVESWSFPAVPGELGMQGVEIRGLSDREFALNLRAQ